MSDAEKARSCSCDIAPTAAKTAMPTNSRPIGNVSANVKPVSAASGTAYCASALVRRAGTDGPSGSGGQRVVGLRAPRGRPAVSGTAGPGIGHRGLGGGVRDDRPGRVLRRGDLEHGAAHDEEPLLLSWREAASSTSTRRWWRPS